MVITLNVKFWHPKWGNYVKLIFLQYKSMLLVLIKTDNCVGVGGWTVIELHAATAKTHEKKYLQWSQSLQSSEGIWGQWTDLVVAQISEKKWKMFNPFLMFHKNFRTVNFIDKKWSVSRQSIELFRWSNTKMFEFK